MENENSPGAEGEPKGIPLAAVDEKAAEATAAATPEVASAETTSVDSRIAELEKAQKELHERLLRTAADYDNYRKRTKREAEDNFQRGRDAVLKDLLPVVDNLERALGHAPADNPLTQGVKMVEKQFLTALEKFGVVRFSALGSNFDPMLHEAIQQVETVEFPEGAVAVEFAKGYRAGERLIRPAMVGVAKAPAAVAAAPESEVPPSEESAETSPASDSTLPS